MNRRVKKHFLTVFLVFLAIWGFDVRVLAATFNNPGLLPSNPFYFVKEWSRELRRALTFNDLNKLRLELEILNERAAEVNKLAKLMSDDSGLIKIIVENYNSNLDLLISDLKILKMGDENQVDKFLSDLTAKILFHIQVFDVLDSKNINASTNKQLEVINIVVNDLDGEREFRRRIVEVVAERPSIYNSLRTAEILEKLENYVDDGSRHKIHRLKNDLLLDFSGQEQLPESGDLLIRLRALDDLRIKVVDPTVKNKLNLLRQDVFRLVEERELISAEVVANLLTESDKAISFLEKRVKTEKEIPPLVRKMHAQSQFYQNQAKRFYDENYFSASFGQASSALATSRLASFFLTSVAADYYLYEITLLKLEYDKLTEKKGGNKEIEDKIINLSDFIKKSKVAFPNESVENSLINIRILLAKFKYDVR